MGLSTLMYWVHWIIHYTLFTTVITGLVTIILTDRVLPQSDGGLLYLYLWIYGMSNFGYVALMQSFFQSPRIASIITTLVYFLSQFLDQAVDSKALGENAKYWASLVPTIAMSRAAQNLMAFEDAG
jgi:uncharacterized membrane protein